MRQKCSTLTASALEPRRDKHQGRRFGTSCRSLTGRTPWGGTVSTAGTHKTPETLQYSEQRRSHLWKQRLHKRAEAVAGRRTLSAHVCVCVCVWWDQSISSLTFSSCHGAKTPSAPKPERNGAPALRLSLKPRSCVSRPLFTSQCCYRNGCFVLLSLPPSLSYLSFPVWQHHSKATSPASISLISRSWVWRQGRMSEFYSSYINLTINSPFNLLCEYSSLSSFTSCKVHLSNSAWGIFSPH